MKIHNTSDPVRRKELFEEVLVEYTSRTGKLCYRRSTSHALSATHKWRTLNAEIETNPLRKRNQK